MCFQTETQLAENNPLQHYYLSPAVRAAMSFSMIVYQAAYLCRHDNSVNNRWVLSFRLRCEIDSVTYAVISMETERSCGSQEFLLALLKDITRQLMVSNSSPCCSDPSPSQFPTLLARRIYCCPSTQIKRGGEKKPWKSMWQPNVHSQWPFDQFISKIQLNCHRGEKRKPHVQSVWSPRSSGASIASLFSSALLR